MSRPRLALLLTALLALGIAFGTLMPTGLNAPPLPGGDKLHHLLGFAALVLPGIALMPRWTLAFLAFGLGLGALIEVIQPSVGRARELADLIADALGLGLGAAAGLTLAALRAALTRL